MTEQLYRTDAYLRDCHAQVLAVNERGIVLDRTVFYAAAGGQPGDKGAIEIEGGGSCPIATTVYDADKTSIVHVPAEGAALPSPGQSVRASLDWDFRSPLMRMHTCLHLLCAVVTGDVTGGQVGDGKGRLDFNLPDTRLDKDAIAAALNRLIAEDHAVTVRWITDAELEAAPELVRTMSVKPPSGAGRVRLLDIEGVDLQPCGGTHVRNTSEIGPLKLGKIEKKGAINRRVAIHFA